MERDIPIHKGSLLIPAVGKITVKEIWQKKYCMLYKRSKFGLERIEIHNRDSANQTSFMTITLQGFIEIITSGSTFAIVTKNGNHEFDAGTTTSLNEWVLALESVVFPDDCSKITSIEEDNDLYCPSGKDVFNVKLSSSPASVRCGLEAKHYILVLANDGVQLRKCDDNELLFTWPYCFIRRYGYKNGKFNFEAGRKCASGEGIFSLEYPDQQTIFRCFASKIKSMKKHMSFETLPTMLSTDNYFQAASNKEARSRSPLPVLPNLSSYGNDSENSYQEIGDSIAAKLNSVLRPTPSKPPRKSLNTERDKSKIHYANVNKYEEIEYRSDAWKTMGVGDVNHVESEGAEPEEYYMSWGQIKKEQNVIPKMIHAPKIINEPENGEDYDKLNFFGSVSKMNNSSTYKQVTISSKDSLLSNPPSFNDYDEVDVEPAMSDNMIQSSLRRKENDIDHQFHNNDPYALITKHKRV
ncbi:hypothetical protein WA026_003752 [Henosepilachna vigintioctopunctata]|uniref:Insulin receptor substrate 1 n=1 Tax=Henosepilachna vigintioctopunctata TaxID=420089 RepID=A0AAW1UFM1_9CUCU